MHPLASQATTPAAGPMASWARPLAVATAAVFFVSLAFPLVAGISEHTESFPKWWGAMDVGLAFVLATLALGVMAVARGRVTKEVVDATYRAYRILNHGIFVMLVVFFLAGDRITWANCLSGLAWRAWLLLYVLPDWFTAIRRNATN